MADLSGSMQGVAAESGKMMGSAKKSAGAADDGGMAELYKLNQVYYGMPPTLSLVAKRTILINQAQQHSYTNPYSQNITFIFNTGEYYVAPTTSYLYIQLGYNNPTVFAQAKACISQGNVMQLFEEVVFTSASGTEVCREQNKGLNSAFTYRYNNTQEYINTYGQVQGAPFGNYSTLHSGNSPVYALTMSGDPLGHAGRVAGVLGGTEGIIWPRSGGAAQAYFGSSCSNLSRSSNNVLTTDGTYAPGTPALSTLSFCVPLDQVIGCFNPYMKALIPAGLLAGGRLDLRLKEPNEALQFAGSCIESSAGGTADTNLAALILQQKTAMVISNIYIGFDAFQLQDNVLKRLNQVSAGENGLSLLFNTYDYTTTNKSGTGDIECQIQQARSRIVRSWCVVRDNANLTNNYVNSLASEAAVVRVSASVRPGTRAMPTAAITNTSVNGWGGGLTLYNQMQAATGAGYGAGSQTGTAAGSLQGFVQIIPSNVADPNFNTSTGGTPTVGSYQGVLGALYFPQQPITTPAEYYTNALYLFCKSQPDKDQNCSVTYEDFLGGLGAALQDPAVAANPRNPTLGTSYRVWAGPYGLAVYGILAEKSQLLQLSGLPISNARLLRHRFYFPYTTPSGQDRIISCFTEYTRVCKVFLGGRIVVRE